MPRAKNAPNKGYRSKKVISAPYKEAIREVAARTATQPLTGTQRGPNMRPGQGLKADGAPASVRNTGPAYQLATINPSAGQQVARRSAAR